MYSTTALLLFLKWLASSQHFLSKLCLLFYLISGGFIIFGWKNCLWQSEAVGGQKGLVLMAGVIGIIKNNEPFYLHPFVFLFLSQLFGCGSVAQTVLSKGALGEPLTIHIGFTLGVMMAVYMAGGVSGIRSPWRHTQLTFITKCIHFINSCSLFPLSFILLIIFWINGLPGHKTVGRIT